MVVVGIEEDKMAREVGIHQLQSEGSCQSCEERPPHDFVREIVGYLETEGILIPSDTHRNLQYFINILCENLLSLKKIDSKSQKSFNL